MIERGGSMAKRWMVLALAAALVAGCSTNAPRAARDPDRIRVAVADRAAFDKVVHNLRGDVVLVDFWASWCTPCVANFPHMIELANRDRPRGLTLVTVNMDAPEAAENTTAFLKEQRASVATNLISQLGGSSQSMEVFEISNGALPCYKLYDRKGQLRQTFALNPAAEKQFTLQEVEAAVEQLLAE
jgi:thiol-disulfide isomerase/thioredoxin